MSSTALEQGLGAFVQGSDRIFCLLELLPEGELIGVVLLGQFTITLGFAGKFLQKFFISLLLLAQLALE